MKKLMISKLLAGTAALALPLMASASSTYTTGTTGTLTATATVNLQVVIQRNLYLRVGTSTGTTATTATTDLITFNAPLGTTGAVAGVGGDLTAGVETAAVLSNGGSTVTLVATTNTNGLSDGGGVNFIPFTQITTTAAQDTSGTVLPAPTLANGTSNTVTLTAPGTTKVINQDAKWTYAFANTGTYPAGTYGGTTNNGTVTYTATMP